MKASPKPSRYTRWQDLFNPQDPWAHYITNALKAKELFVKDVNYIVRDGEAVIVDEFTGRVMPGRRWSDGQHQPSRPEACRSTGNTDSLRSRIRIFSCSIRAWPA